MAPPQPAIKSYFFGKGYRDLGATIKHTWLKNWADAGNMFNKTAENWRKGEWFYLLAVFWFVAGVMVVLFGSIWFFALSILHVVLLLILFSIIYMCFSLLWLTERTYMGIKRIFTACPKCHQKFDLPKYLCPNCGSEHTRLIPNSYGILKRVCRCGEKLPSVFFNGRQNLPAKCPNCNYDIDTQEAKPICLPIIGGPSVGKTCFLFSATHQLKEDVGPKKGWNLRMINRENEMTYQNLERRFQGGMAPDKTTELNPTAFNFFIESDKWSPGKVVYLYDSAGEAFSHTDHLNEHQFYGFIHGFLFLIDPFSIPRIAHQYQAELSANQTAIKPSSMDLEDAFDAMLINLERNHGVKRDQRISKPCAVIINKIDAFDLEQTLGDEAATSYKNTQGIETLQESRNRVCREYFNQAELGNFIRKLDSKFKSVRFFTCSALGNPSTSGFAPIRSEEPILWLLGHADKQLR